MQMDEEGVLGCLYLNVVLCVMDGRNGNEMAMLDVYDVEGKVRAALAQKNRIGSLGKALGGPTSTGVPRLKASSSHTFNSVNRHHCVLLKRQATDGGRGSCDWLNCPGIAILQPLKVRQYTSCVSTFICEHLLRHGMVPRWD